MKTNTIKLSPSEKGRLTKLRAKLVSTVETWTGEDTIWWQVRRGKKSLSGHPLGCPHAAIKATAKGARA